MAKSADAFRTISEVSDWLETPAHVLRFWESRFSQVKPVKRAGGRRYYRPGDMRLLSGIKRLLHDDGLTIKGVQKILREQGVKYVSTLGIEVRDTARRTTSGGDDTTTTDDIADEETPIEAIIAASSATVERALFSAPRDDGDSNAEATPESGPDIASEPEPAANPTSDPAADPPQAPTFERPLPRVAVVDDAQPEMELDAQINTQDSSDPTDPPIATIEAETIIAAPNDAAQPDPRNAEDTLLDDQDDQSPQADPLAFDEPGAEAPQSPVAHDQADEPSQTARIHALYTRLADLRARVSAGMS